MTIPTNRVRAKRPKTKTGCQTCRIRRIKCDETRPACCRCTLGGWTCDGYASDGAPSNRSAISTTTICPKNFESWINTLSFSRPWYLPLSKLSYQEGLAYTFFRQHTAAQLQDGMQSQLWDRLAMQISHQEPAILHAIIAVGAMHNARSDQAGMRDESLQQLALSNYAKAVVKLRDRITKVEKRQGVDITLLACILFVGFEMLQHEISLAMEHLRLGLNLITDHRDEKTNAGNLKVGPVTIKGFPAGLLDELVPIFVRLDYGAPMFGRRYPMLDLAHDEYNLRHSLSIPVSFDSVLQAKSYLDLLSSGVFRLRGDLVDIAEKEALDAGLPIGSDEATCYIQARSRSVDLGSQWHQILTRKQALEAGLAGFCRALDALVASADRSADRSCMAVQIQYILVFFTITNCRETHEMLCDGFQDLFETAIEMGEKYIQSAPGFVEAAPARNLSLEPGVIPTIFLVANKCRQPSIRRRAIKLVETGCKQEAMWDGKPFAAFLQQVWDLETARARLCSDAQVSLCEDTLSYPESARFSDVVIADELDRSGRGTLVCARCRHETDGLIEVVEHKIAFDGQEIRPICPSARATTPTP